MGGVSFSSLATTNRTRGRLKLHQRKFRFAIRKKFFTEGMIGHWNRLLREMVESLSLEVLKKVVALGAVV